MLSILTIAPTQPSIAALLAEGLSRVERRFRDQLETPIGPVAELCAHVERYRGKMLRPTVLLLSGLAASEDGGGTVSEDHVSAAAVLEMIHMATLVHDDVLDEAEVRRGGDTVNRRRGNEAAVILGDYLISRSFHLCSGIDNQRVALRVGEVTGVVCEGEMLQLHHRDDYALSEALYFEIIRRKTASLIALACELGACLSGAREGVAARFHAFGERIGAAFQIQDDLLDLVGEERVVGKSLGKDLEKGKPTLPIIHYLSSLTAAERAAAVERIRRAGAAGLRDAGLPAELERSGSIAYARSRAAGLIAEAKSLLEGAPGVEARVSLLRMADAVLERSF